MTFAKKDGATLESQSSSTDISTSRPEDTPHTPLFKSPHETLHVELDFEYFLILLRDEVFWVFF